MLSRKSKSKKRENKNTTSTSQAPNPDYNVSEFKYSKEKDHYLCPQKQTLTTNGRWYAKKGANSYKMKQYKTPACKNCPVINQCTRNTKGRGRVIERTEYADYVDKNREIVTNKQHFYKRQQQIVEHPYGTIKRQWGYNYIITKKGIDRASADVGLMFIAYNFRRLLNIIGKEAFRNYLIFFALLFSAFFGLIKRKISHFYVIRDILNIYVKNIKDALYYFIFGRILIIN